MRPLQRSDLDNLAIGMFESAKAPNLGQKVVAPRAAFEPTSSELLEDVGFLIGFVPAPNRARVLLCGDAGVLDVLRVAWTRANS